MIDISFTYADLEYFLLIFVRVVSFIYIAPFFSMSNTPQRIRIVLGLFIALFIFRTMPHDEVSYTTLTGFAAIVCKEAVCGFLIGFGANLCITITAFAGHITDMETGLSMASMFDPTTKEQTSITGVYYNYTILLMLFISGMYQFILSALIQSFALIPINGVVLRVDAIVSTMLQFLSDYILIGFQIALPVFVTMILVNAILGALAKVSPQLNMFAVGIQIKVLVGLSILAITVGMMPTAAAFILDEIKKMVRMYVGIMQ